MHIMQICKTGLTLRCRNIDFDALPDTTSHCQGQVSRTFITNFTSPQSSKRQDASDHCIHSN